MQRKQLLSQCLCTSHILTRKAPNTTIAEFANTVDTDETAHNEPLRQDLQCLPPSLLFFNIIQGILKVFQNFADVILSSAFLSLYELNLGKTKGRTVCVSH